MDQPTNHEDQVRTRDRLLEGLYGQERATEVSSAVSEVLSAHRGPKKRSVLWDESDVWLITYPDQFRQSGVPPLASLLQFARTYLRGWFNGIHVLPFFPSSSDGGFSVRDYVAVDPQFGTWDHVEDLAGEWRLMVDAVINHASTEGVWFRHWLAGDPAFREFFRTSDPTADLSATVRAREHPLLTRFQGPEGSHWVWTTFSADQADLDYRNPAVLTRVLEVLLEYCAHGVQVLRLDAACFLWKEQGSPSINLRQTHEIIAFFRSCISEVYPDVVIITETNIPHLENISYFGTDLFPEAHAVYQFPLPPLVVHTYTTGDASVLSDWLTALDPPPPGATYLNFLASHDGVGLRPLEGLVSAERVDHLVAEATLNGALVNRRADESGRRTPYEINSTWYDLIRGGATADDALARFLSSHALMLALQGVPAIYVHSLFASANDVKETRRTGDARAINRHKFSSLEALESELSREDSRAARAMNGLKAMMETRRSSSAFSPSSSQRVLEVPNGVIGIERSSGAARARVYTNVTAEVVKVRDSAARSATGIRHQANGQTITLGPWGSCWIIEA